MLQIKTQAETFFLKYFSGRNSTSTKCIHGPALLAASSLVLRLKSQSSPKTRDIFQNHHNLKISSLNKTCFMTKASSADELDLPGGNLI